MPETVSDTGPVLHLQEISRLTTLSVVAPLSLPDLVLEELEARAAGKSRLDAAGIEFTISPVKTEQWREILRTVAPQIQPADAQVFALIRDSGFKALGLTDDLDLRSVLESHGAQVVGSVGILVRAYKSGLIGRDDLEDAIDDLFDRSTLHLSRAFRAYLRQFLKNLA
ncbi:MAG TPA: hypothetical protein VG477_14965 [Thermoanaerobaculia bacterium]|nr:hypothetical protein [Thermoanaerobaculia bacterium]